MLTQGGILKKLIKEKGYRQEDFAASIPVSRTYLIRLFDKKYLKQDFLELACKELSVDISVFDIDTQIVEEPPAKYGKNKNDEESIEYWQKEAYKHLKEIVKLTTENTRLKKIIEDNGLSTLTHEEKVTEALKVVKDFGERQHKFEKTNPIKK
ncbi:MAG: helix-turn-helix transcriptional regulator [Bacteroidota bacterium]